METQTKIKVVDLAQYFEDHLESQYYDHELQSISDVVFVDGFTVATATYTLGVNEPYSTTPILFTRRWSYRREDWDDRIVAYFHDQSDLTQAATVPGT